MQLTENRCLGVLALVIFSLTLFPLIVILGLIATLVYNIILLITCQYHCCKKDVWEDPVNKPHHKTNGRFMNPWKSSAKTQQSAFWRIADVFVILWDWRPVSNNEAKQCSLKLQTIDYNKLKNYFSSKKNRDSNHENRDVNTDSREDDGAKQIQCTWLGHACCLLQFDGFNVLTDPVFSERCSAYQWGGPKRYTPAPAGVWDASNFPIIDVLLISHNHYDHLDFNTIKYLNDANKVRYYCVPLRIGAWLQKYFKIPPNKIIELDWWQSSDITINSKDFSSDYGSMDSSYDSNKLTLICTPSQHFSGRIVFDNEYTLWASWVVQSKSVDSKLLHNIYFAGDTGYRTVPRKIARSVGGGSGSGGCCAMVGAGNWDCRDENIIEKENELDTCPAFREIGEKYGPFDISLLPIGAYSPRWFMSCIHLSPYDACCVHRDLKSKKSIGIHWGTWVLTDEKLDEPPKLLEEMKVRKEFGIKKDEFIVLDPGETILV